MKKIYLLFCMAIATLIYTQQEAYADMFKITVSPTTINFYLKDMSNSNISGYYLPTGTIVAEIPYMGIYQINGESDIDNPTLEQQWNELHEEHSINQGVDTPIPSGTYRLVVYGNNIITETAMKITVFKYWSNGGSVLTGSTNHLFPGLTYTYEFDIPTVPPINNEIELIKVSNPQEMIAEIKAFAKAGHIGNTGFVNELIEKIQEIEKERLKPAEKDDKLTPAQKAKKEYQELMDEIDEKNAKPEKDEYVHDIAAMLLRRDIDYIINHIQ